MSRSRTSRHTDSFLDERDSKPLQKTAGSRMPRSTSSASDDAKAGVNSLAEPPERSASKKDGSTASSRAALSEAHRQEEHTAQQARDRLEKKLKRLEPNARSDASMPHPYMDHAKDTAKPAHSDASMPHAYMDQAKDTAKPAREHGSNPLHVQSQGKDASKKPQRQARSRSSTSRKAVWCGNNKLDKKLRVNGGHLEVGSPHACFMRGVGGGIHQEIPPGEEDAFLEKWLQPYEKMVDQPIYYKDGGPVPHGMFRCTLPQAMQRGFAVGSKKRAQSILKKRGHTTHGA
jgi:hypothetical protein